jgi:hypothetical protein
MVEMSRGVFNVEEIRSEGGGLLSEAVRSGRKDTRESERELLAIE